jgi:tetratricopeptide (TPR) repeat protein
VELLEKGDTQASLRIFAELVSHHGADAAVRIGPAFGNIYYQMGIALERAGNPEGAINAFKQCYLVFGNRDDRPESNNLHHGQALVKWAELEQQLGHGKNATKLLARALREHTEGAQREVLLYNLASALESTGDTKRAVPFYELLLGGDKNLTPSEEVKRKSFLSLARNLADSGELNRVEGLLDTYESLLEGPPVDRYNWTADLLHVGRRCVFAGDPVLALRWYRYAAHPEDVLLQLEEKLALTPHEHADDAIAAVRFMRAEVERNSMGDALLKARAGAFVTLELFRIALPAYERLLRNDSLEDRDEVLYAAAICAARVGRPDDAAVHAAPLLQRSPPYFRSLEVVTAWAQSLMDASRHQEAFEISDLYRIWAEHGHPDREGLDFIAAAALFQTDRFPDALESFAEFLRDHKDSERRDAASYYRALSAVHAERWHVAGQLLDDFLASYPESDHHHSGLYYRAMTHVVLEEDEIALAVISQLEQNHPEAIHLAAALNLRGDIAFRESRWTDADDAYGAAIDTAESVPEATNDAAYALYQQVRVASAQDAWEDTENRFMLLRTEYPVNPYLARGCILAAAARENLGKPGEALDMLSNMIASHADRWRNPDLPRLLTAHHGMYERVNSRDALVGYLRNALETAPDSLRAWLLIGIIDTLEPEAGKDDEDEVASAYARIETEFTHADLDSPILIKLASWFVSKEAWNDAISAYLVIVDDRVDDPERNPARVALARALMQRRIDTDLDLACKYLAEADREVTDPVWVESVTLELARARTIREEWAAAELRWREYVNMPEWGQSRAEANYELARCLDMLGRNDSALKQYTLTYVQYEGHIEWSSRAFLRVALMLEEAGKKQEAFTVLDDMMNRLGNLSHPFVNRARTLHGRWQMDAAYSSGGNAS